MAELTSTLPVRGPWSLDTSRRFWEGFTPSALTGQRAGDVLRTTFLVDEDWRPATAVIGQDGEQAHVRVAGDGDLDAAARQTARFLALDIDGAGWPDVGRRDPVIGELQRQLPGFRPTGFHSPYEAAVWSVLSQRMRIPQAAALRARLARTLGEGTTPPPSALVDADLDLPGRKAEYLRAVAGAALDGLLTGATLRALDPDDAVSRVREVKGLGPFGAQLVVVRGANTPDATPREEPRLVAEIAARYGEARALGELSEMWRPYRTWATVHLRALGEVRESGGRDGSG